MSIPEKIITRRNESKYILKRAVRGLIPDDVIDQRKQGFGVPIHEWFSGRFGRFARHELEEFCEKTDFLDKTAVMNLIPSGRARHAWLVLNFALWWKEFVEGGKAKVPDDTRAIMAGS